MEVRKMINDTVEVKCQRYDLSTFCLMPSDQHRWLRVKTPGNANCHLATGNNSLGAYYP